MQQPRHSPRAVQEPRGRLGEGPVWDDRTQSLFWVDIYNHRIHQFFPEREAARLFEMGDTVGSLALTEGDALIVALRHELVRLDLTTGERQRLAGIEEGRWRNRLNDGKCDPGGRFWVGSMSRDEGEAALYRFDPDTSVHVMETGITIANGPAWSPDGSRMYFTDSQQKTIFVYDFDVERGEASHRRVFVDLSDGEPAPDGMTVDEEGCLWTALWDGSCLLRFAPDGRIAGRVDAPVVRPTSCAFGGLDFRDLYFTSASVGLGEEEIEENFHSGDLFLVRSDVRGLPAQRFAG